MKITVIPKEKPEPKKILYDEIEPGTAYVCAFQGNVMLKLQNGEAAALTFADTDSECFSIACVTKGQPATKILGRLREIVVEEI